MLRYLRLQYAFMRFSLAQELAFRGNFLAKVFVELLWLGLVLAFYQVVFAKTPQVADWPREQFLFFLGCFMALEGIIETFFMSNCAEFSELVRSGDLDLYLLKPIDEQYLVTCNGVDWSTAGNIVVGFGVMGFALRDMGWQFDPLRVGLFVVLFASGVAMAYCFMVLFSALSIWMVRNQNLAETWWLFTSLMRYPKEMYVGKWAGPLGKFFTFVVPVLLIVNVPARVMVKPLDEPHLALLLVAATVAVFLLTRVFFRFSLSRYRSASS
ncbi:MAG: ABC-2 family transporter protein [Gemmatales bacterium]|nr:ABC-2 family transporter protein [Gemmatales bacterium]MDW8388377.1 ABC-2 family transporter protein [Gemmatales bacterium]